MNKVIEYTISILILALAYPLGTIIRNSTKDELKQGKPYFKALIYLSLLIGFTAAILKIDWLMFSAFFISIFTSSALN